MASILPNQNWMTCCGRSPSPESVCGPSDGDSGSTEFECGNFWHLGACRDQRLGWCLPRDARPCQSRGAVAASRAARQDDGRGRQGPRRTAHRLSSLRTRFGYLGRTGSQTRTRPGFRCRRIRARRVMVSGRRRRSACPQPLLHRIRTTAASENCRRGSRTCAPAASHGVALTELEIAELFSGPGR